MFKKIVFLASGLLALVVSYGFISPRTANGQGQEVIQDALCQTRMCTGEIGGGCADPATFPLACGDRGCSRCVATDAAAICWQNYEFSECTLLPPEPHNAHECARRYRLDCQIAGGACVCPPVPQTPTTEVCSFITCI